jgi:DNA-binding MarR family transcriptional regulator
MVLSFAMNATGTGGRADPPARGGDDPAPGDGGADRAPGDGGADRAPRGGDDPAPGGDARTANLLGAYALRASTAMTDALGAGSDAAALIALLNFADGQEPLRRALGLSQPGTVHVVDRLVANGLAARAPSPEDRRRVLIALTPRGRRAARRLLAARERALIIDLDGALDAQERAQLTGLLEKLLAAATDGRDQARRICRLCDTRACGHPRRCPVTQAAACAGSGSAASARR